MPLKTYVVKPSDFSDLEAEILDRVTTVAGTIQTDEEIIAALVTDGWEEVIVRRAMTKLKRSGRLKEITETTP